METLYDLQYLFFCFAGHGKRKACSTQYCRLQRGCGLKYFRSACTVRCCRRWAKMFVGTDDVIWTKQTRIRIHYHQHHCNHHHHHQQRHQTHHNHHQENRTDINNNKSSDTSVNDDDDITTYLRGMTNTYRQGAAWRLLKMKMRDTQPSFGGGGRGVRYERGPRTDTNYWTGCLDGRYRTTDNDGKTLLQIDWGGQHNTASTQLVLKAAPKRRPESRSVADETGVANLDRNLRQAQLKATILGRIDTSHTTLLLAKICPSVNKACSIVTRRSIKMCQPLTVPLSTGSLAPVHRGYGTRRVPLHHLFVRGRHHLVVGGWNRPGGSVLLELELLVGGWGSTVLLELL